MELLLCKEKLVLPTSYKEQLQVLLEKRIEITIKLRKFKYEGRFNLINGHDIINLCSANSSNKIIKSLTIDELVVYITTEKMLKSILQDIATIVSRNTNCSKKSRFL